MEILLENFTVKKTGICEVLFFPSQENEAKIIEYLKSAKKSIYVCVFTITNERLCTALLEAHLRGVDVKMITDDEEIKMISNIRDLSEEGISIRTDDAKNALMHNKFVIIDGHILMTGSYNWTVRATKANQENVVVIENKYLVDTFTQEFNKLWKQFTPQIFEGIKGKAKKKTRLYHKYMTALEKQREAAEKEKQKQKDTILMIHEDEEEKKEAFVEPGVRKESKKIAKTKPASRYTQKSKYKSVADKSPKDKPQDSPKLSTFFFRLVLMMLGLFGLILFAHSPFVKAAVGNGMEIENGNGPF